MRTVINDQLISWASDIEPGTLRQAEKTARLPIIAGHVALMPDAHVGIGATVGSVIPTCTRTSCPTISNRSWRGSPG